MVKTIENARTIALKSSETLFRNNPCVNMGLSIVINFKFLFNLLCVMFKNDRDKQAGIFRLPPACLSGFLFDFI